MTYFTDLAATLERLDLAELEALRAFVGDCAGTLWICGNGGSMATAQHWACDLSKAAGRRVQALGSNPAVLTAWANDTGYENALSYELTCNARAGDRLLCFSCSGTSPNIAQVLSQAAFIGDIPMAIVTGARWESPIIAPVLVVNVPATHYGIIEDCHLAIGHWLTDSLRYEAA